MNSKRGSRIFFSLSEKCVRKYLSEVTGSDILAWFMGCVRSLPPRNKSSRNESEHYTNPLLTMLASAFLLCSSVGQHRNSGLLLILSPFVLTDYLFFWYFSSQAFMKLFHPKGTPSLKQNLCNFVPETPPFFGYCPLPQLTVTFMLQMNECFGFSANLIFSRYAEFI